VAELFVDTSAWLPLADPQDPHHGPLARALRERVRQGARIVTTNLVLAETHVLLLRRVHREAALAFLREVRRPPHLVVNSTEDHEVRAQHDWLERYADQDFSFTDAVSFTVMAERGVRDALALDRHFVAAGFNLVKG
jgi:predicted nucleic acid-binding protein